MDLEQLLLQLAGLTERAQAIWVAEVLADEDSGYESEDEIEGVLWLTLERSVIPRTIDPWMCGYRVQQDEATVWALMVDGPTPLAAATALLAEIQEPTSNPEYAPTPDSPF